MQIYDQERTPFRHYDEGWNARVLGEPYRTDTLPAWRDGYNDCAEAPGDDRTFMIGPDRPRPHFQPRAERG